MKTAHISKCPLCSSDSFIPYLECKDYYATQESFHLSQCVNCGFVYTQDFPAEDEIGKYYHVQDYISHSDTQKGIINKLYHLVRNFSLKSKSKLVIHSSGKQTGSLLDYGCGTGYFLNAMDVKGWSVSGIEKDEGARSYAKDKFRLDVQSDNYLFQVPENQLDVVTMWHVLEHVEKLNECMSQLYKVLKGDGTLVIALPNRNSCDAQHYKQFWAAYDVPRHLWHFSSQNFENLANKHNFKVVDIKPMHFDGFYISMLSEKYKKTIAGTLVGLLKGGVFFLRSLTNKQKSSSLIYILKKK